MRKGFIVSGIIFIAVLGAIYWLIPSRVIVLGFATVECNFPATKRFVFEEKNWSAWLSANSSASNGYSHRIINTFFSNTDIIISKKKEVYQTSFVIIPYNIDSTGIEWRDTLLTGNNPFTRISQYVNARRLKKHIDTVMASLTSFLNDKTRVYGVNIKKERVTDRPLLATRQVTTTYPEPSDAYRLIALLRDYARKQGDTCSGPAMKNVTRIDSTHFELMVAIPTNTYLKGTNEFIPKGLVGGNPIATEFTGGEASISNAWKGIRQYKEDYRLSSPAIPYELMITDRQKEPDTAKWVTKIVYPTRL
jgi:hypothetical protein